MAGEEEEGTTLEFTPTWVVAAVCTVIVGISLAVERSLHFTGKYLKKKNQKPLYEALQKVKECTSLPLSEVSPQQKNLLSFVCQTGVLDIVNISSENLSQLMLLGFISLLLTAFQARIVKICVPDDTMTHLLPCSLPSVASSSGGEESLKIIPNSMLHKRRLLAEDSEDYCKAKGKVPLLSLESLHHLHTFIFVLAVVHVTLSVLTVVFGGAKIHQWKHWEDSISKDSYNTEPALKPSFTHVHQHDFIKKRFSGVDKHSALLSWLQSFFKQFYGSVTKSDYSALRLGFIMTHCRGNPKFNFHRYMIRALEADFKTVVGIRWYLWIFFILFLLLNINGWHTYFWMAFIPFVLLLAVGTKLEHVISQLAHEVAEKHVAIEGELVVQPSDDHFWFHRPHIILLLIHFILFQNAFEIAFFFWIWVQYGFDSCIMGQVQYIVPRILIGIFIQVLCSYSTLPLYALVTQMGSHFKKSIFDDHVRTGLLGWAETVRNKKRLRTASGGSSQRCSTEGSSAGIRISGTSSQELAEVQPAYDSENSKD